VNLQFYIENAFSRKLLITNAVEYNIHYQVYQFSASDCGHAC